MKVLLVNTSQQTGGAAIAALRLKNALNQQGVKAKMLVSRKVTGDVTTVELPSTRMFRWHFLKERLGIWLTNRFHKKHLFDIDTASDGTDITRLPEYKEADVIHLHWINQGFVSLKGIDKILRSGKPIVWTMHDMWPLTGICHYAHDCRRFTEECKWCPLLVAPGKNDLSRKTFLKKREIYGKGKIQFVACSDWLAGEARRSAILAGKDVRSIPNPINVDTFKPRDKKLVRRALQLPEEKVLVLFSAYRTTLPIKGLAYFKEALERFRNTHPEWNEKLAILAVGKDAEKMSGMLPYDVYDLGYIEDECKMAEIYAAADVFVIPSLQDNLPNTIVEAMASGVPTIGFKVGGIPQMIEHKVDGYLAEPRNAEDLKDGLEWILIECDYNEVCKHARAHAMKQYETGHVARLYIEVYNQLMKEE